MNEDALATAAKPTSERIAQDREGASQGVRQLLDHIAEHLFDPGYGLEDLRRACGDEPEERLGAFVDELGRPETYVAEARLATAMLLLLQTDWPVARISEKVGYLEPARFASACKRHFDMTPSQYRTARRSAAAAGHRAESAGSTTAGKVLCFSAEATSPLPEEEKSRIARRMADELAEYLDRRNPARQLDLLRNRMLFGGPELLELLSRKSREVGRRDRRLAVRFAEAGLAAVEGSRALLGERYGQLHALALGRLANALRLAGDLAAADELLQRADQTWATPGSRYDKRIETELFTIKGTLRLFQRRYGEARKLLGDALEFAERIDDVPWQIIARLQRAAVAVYEGRPGDAIPDLRAVAALLDNEEEPDHFQQLGVYQDLALAYVETGQIERAEPELCRAKALCEELDLTASRHQQQWIEGLIAKARERPHEAERLFREAKAGFGEIGDNYAVAMAALEIAILCHEQGRGAEVVALVSSEVIPVLESLALRREALGALTLLREAVADNQVALAVLEAAREALRTIRSDPARTRPE